ncbi:MAG: HlyD family secretion protein [Bacteroidales bacterium]|nr:HlyD family secretion protein [Bacteroidales bacterium]
MKVRFFLCIGMIGLSASCRQNKPEHDAFGIFEATEVTVLAETSGQLAALDIKKGAQLTAGQPVGYVDSALLYLKKMQLTAAQRAMAARDSVDNNKGINPLAAEMEQVNDLLAKCRIVNPVEGVVSGKYAEVKDIVATGKPLYRIADMKHLFLQAYIASKLLDEVQTGQKATVYITLNGTEKIFEGTVTWISNKAEPIQNKDERQALLVYAVKIAVDNTEGLLKAGIRGNVDFAK